MGIWSLAEKRKMSFLHEFLEKITMTSFFFKCKTELKVINLPSFPIPSKSSDNTFFSVCVLGGKGRSFKIEGKEYVR